MHVFVAGATGVVGRPLIPQLIAAGHRVTATTRTPAKAAELRVLGAEPVIADGTGVWSWIHVDDAAAATVAALERGASGIYNVTDDEPARVSEWLPYLADAVGRSARCGYRRGRRG